MGEVLAHALLAGTRRLQLNLLPRGAGCTLGNDEQGGQALACLPRQGVRDPAMVGTIDQGARGAGALEERAKGRQLPTVAEELLYAGVDDVGEVVAGARRRNAGPHGDAAGLTVVAHDTDETAHQSRKADTVRCIVVAADLVDGAVQADGCGNVGDDRDRHVGQTGEVAKALEGLKQNQQRQAWARLARPLPRERDLGGLRRERLQLGDARVGGQAWVSGCSRSAGSAGSMPSGRSAFCVSPQSRSPTVPPKPPFCICARWWPGCAWPTASSIRLNASSMSSARTCATRPLHQRATGRATQPSCIRCPGLARSSWRS